jgi:hypothetical protein
MLPLILCGTGGIALPVHECADMSTVKTAQNFAIVFITLPNTTLPEREDLAAQSLCLCLPFLHYPFAATRKKRVVSANRREASARSLTEGAS